MKNKIKIKRLITILITFVLLALSLGANSYASSVSMSPSYTTLEIGKTKTITITYSGMNGRFDISSSNKSIVSLSTNSVFVGEGTVTLTATAKAAGTATISLIPYDVANSVDPFEDITGTIGTKTITIKVNAPVVVPPKTTTTVTTNSNTNLKKLVPSYEGLKPNFSSSVTRYSLTVPATATNLGLTVATEGAGAKYSISGDKNLKMGDNTVSITVTATSGAKKVYTIIVTKAEDIVKANAYLSSIVIDGKTLSPEFVSETLEYDIGTVKSDVNKLIVLAFAQGENAKTEIIGNDTLVEGQNTIKVKVTAEDGITVKEYTIKVVKETSALQIVDIYGESNTLQNNYPSRLEKIIGSVWNYLKRFWVSISLTIICLLEFGYILYLYRKIKKIRGTNKSIIKESIDNISSKRRIKIEDTVGKDNIKENNDTEK